ncbi:MAG: transcriptional regulator [Anaerosolibacter sp.]|jgi:transcriptional regulator with XRE-family HTH domain|uniref:helix-turn-helix domain-containing protein n=1 Tax=Anaerosolibacter sp. TaxID=1872527 RepID=UPI00260AFFC1|nr:helix-turn-helix transcriptional regulator [Anaerosolibacter sp.]MDF2545795.1 transcriptional regulator [Anaerosolibacter sp.]
MESIGNRILKLRKELNMTQKELADKAGTTEATLSRYESDLREPKADIIVKIAAALGTSTDYLLGRTNYRDQNFEKESVEKKYGFATKAYHNLDVGGLSEEDISKVEEYIELLKQKYNPDGTLKKKD